MRCSFCTRLVTRSSPLSGSCTGHRSRAVVVSWVAMFSVELTRRLRLTHHIFRPLVLAQTQVGRMAHLACRGPFREFDLSYKLRANFARLESEGFPTLYQ